MTSSVGCCHGDEWHGGAWRQHCVLHMLPLCCHTAATPTTPEERVHCITSSEDKKHFVVLEKCRCISSPLADSFRSASTGLRTNMSLTWESELPLRWFRIEVLSVCQPSCQFELEWVTDSSSEAESHKNWPHVTMCHWSHVICWLHAHFLFTLLYQLLMTLKHLHYEKRAFPVNAQETLPWNSYYPSAVLAN